MAGKLCSRHDAQRLSRLVFGQRVGIQVWAVESDERFFGSVLAETGGPIVLISRRIAGTSGEAEVLNWAMAVIATGRTGFSVLLASGQ